MPTLQPWITRNYARTVKPWYEGVPSSAFVKYSTGETGLMLIQQKYEGARQVVNQLQKVLTGETGPFVFAQWEHIMSQAEREDAALRTSKRPLDAATRFNTVYSRDDCPE